MDETTAVILRVEETRGVGGEGELSGLLPCFVSAETDTSKSLDFCSSATQVVGLSHPCI